MKIGIANEQKNGDRRVALIPSAVQALCEAGAEVFVESGAGTSSSFVNEKYLDAGATVLYSKQEVLGVSDVIMKIAPMTLEETEMIREDQAILGFLHLVVSPEAVIRSVISQKATLIGYEVMETEEGEMPVSKYISTIAGQLCVLIAARSMQSHHGGRGIILGGVPGIPPANVVIIGAGNVGCTAAETAFRLGAQVTVLDQDLRKLENVHNRLGHHVSTMLSNTYNLAKAMAFADVAIGAVLDHGERTPKLVSESVVASMKEGSVIVDLSIDQGGCFETSRPTTFANPTYIHKGVVHYCVPNITSGVARVSSIALSNAILPFLLDMAECGFEKTLRKTHALRKGVYLYQGMVTNPAIAEMYRLPLHSIDTILG